MWNFCSVVKLEVTALFSHQRSGLNTPWLVKQTFFNALIIGTNTHASKISITSQNDFYPSPGASDPAMRPTVVDRRPWMKRFFQSLAFCLRVLPKAQEDRKTASQQIVVESPRDCYHSRRNCPRGICCLCGELPEKLQRMSVSKRANQIITLFIAVFAKIMFGSSQCTTMYENRQNIPAMNSRRYSTRSWPLGDLLATFLWL